MMARHSRFPGPFFRRTVMPHGTAEKDVEPFFERLGPAPEMGAGKAGIINEPHVQGLEKRKVGSNVQYLQ